jgi:2-oxoglutarate ferredoxin oxidoreductase subunit beta
VIFDPTDPSGALSYALTRMTYPEFPVPIGVFRQIASPTYDQGMSTQIRMAQEKKGQGDLLSLYLSSEIWKVGGDGKVSTDLETLKQEIMKS